MADLLIQFHALPEELLQFLRGIVSDFDTHTVAFRFHPFSASEIDQGDLDRVFSDPSFRRLALTLLPPVLPASSGNQFADQNRDGLFVDIGRLTDKGLTESCLAARTDQDQALKIWKQVARRLKSATMQGAVAVNSQTGATSRLPHHRYTEGAKRSYEQGVPILPVAGTSKLRLGEAMENPS